MLKIFLSSVYKSLENARAEVVHKLKIGEFQVINMEAFGARPDLPLEVCLKEIRKAHAAVVVIGPRYGSSIPNGELSYTHREFRECQDRQIPILAFVLPAADDISQEEKEKLEGFIEEAGSSLKYETSSESGLTADVVASLSGAKARGSIGYRYSIFQTYERFFSQQLSTETNNLFSHLSGLVGREDEIAKLINFSQGENRLFIITASGGSGKSRLLLETARALKSDNKRAMPIFFVDIGSQWDDEDIASLPTVPMVLVVDDAHRRSDLDRLISACLEHNPNLKVIISCRPAALPVLKSNLKSYLGLDTDTNSLVLEKLSDKHAKLLAEACLGDEFKGLADRLVKISEKNPLLVTIGAKCIAQKKVAPEILSRNPEEFRHTALNTLLADPTFELGNGEIKRRALELLSAIGPINSANTSCINASAEFLEIKSPELLRIITQLEKSGFILRRGRLIRVTPDVLSDHLLHDAAIDEHHKTTGYVDLIVQKFSSILLGNILANAAELDWRAATTSDYEPVLATTWKAIIESLPAAKNSRRKELIGQLERAAAFAPSEVLKILEWLCDNPVAPKDEHFEHFGLADDLSYLQDALCELFAFIATHPNFTVACVKRIWMFARNDDRTIHSNPQSARRRLQELLEYKVKIPEKVQLLTMKFLIEQLNTHSGDNSYPWAVEILGTVLKREVETTTANKHTITIGGFSLAPYLSKFKSSREEAINTLKNIALKESNVNAARALIELDSLIYPPYGRMGGEVTEDELKTWLDESSMVVEILLNVANNASCEVVRYLAGKKLRSVQYNSWPDLSKVIKEAVKKLKPIDDQDLHDVLFGMPDRMQRRSWEDEEKRVKAMCEDISKNLWKKHEMPKNLVAYLFNLIQLRDQMVSTTHINEWTLVGSIISANMGAAGTMVSELLSTNSIIGFRLIPAVLSELKRLQNNDTVSKILKQLSEEKDPQLRAIIADSFRYLIHSESVSFGDLEYIKPYINDESGDVRTAVVRCLPKFSKVAPKETLELLVNMPWDGNSRLANVVCDVLNPAYGLSPSNLTNQQIATLLKRIESIDDLDSKDHDILEFLTFASTRLPDQTIEMLIKRIKQRSERKDTGIYDRSTPFPYDGRGLHLPGIKNATNKEQILRSIRDHTLDATLVEEYWFAQLFRVACAPGSEAALSLLGEWIDSKDENKISTAAHLLTAFNYTFIFANDVVVSRILEAAASVSTKCLKDTRSILFGMSVSGIYNSSPGEPAPRHVETMSSSKELAEKYKDKPVVKEFYEALSKQAEGSIQRELEEWEEQE